MKRTFPLLLLILALTDSAEDPYVATNDGDSNPGTQAQPWRTIQHAANTLVAGEAVHVSAGSSRRRSALATAAPRDQGNNESVHSNEVQVVIP
jgi:hypothetical protein